MEKQFIVSADHKKIMVKDCDLKSFRKRFPDFNPLMDEMRSILPDGYKFYLVDFIVQDCILGAQTCRDVRWHLDGDFYKDNKYALWAKGPNRTEFPKIMPEFNEVPADRESQNVFLENMSLDVLKWPIRQSSVMTARLPTEGLCARSLEDAFSLG